MEKITIGGGPPGEHKTPRHARPPRRALVGCAHPGPPLVPIFWYISHFDLEKIRRRLSRRSAPLRGATWAGALLPSGRAISPGELPSRRGKSKPSSSPTTLLSLGVQSSSTFNSTISSQNLSSSLVVNLCTRTSYWYLWVTSSVDYIL